MEQAGSVGLSLMAPAAIIAADGRITAAGWALWALMAGQNAPGALYVRLRLADTHNRPTPRLPVLGAHSLVFAAVILGGIQGLVPILTAVPFAGFLARAAWATPQPRPDTNVRRFGPTEVAVEIISGAWIIAAYWL
jgi:hypothetical protein